LFFVKTAFHPSTPTATPLTSKRPHPDRERGHDWSLYLQGNKNPLNSLDITQEASEKPWWKQASVSTGNVTPSVCPLIWSIQGTDWAIPTTERMQFLLFSHRERQNIFANEEPGIRFSDLTL
jgi:hypothetical protein